jgi:hypothetical protein
MKPIEITGIVFAALLGGAAPAVAGLRSPVAATVDVPSYFDIAHVIDKSGLEPAFTDGQDFASYVASGPLAHHMFGDGVWAAGSPSLPAYRSANVDLDLGQAYTIGAMAFWNLGPGDPSSVNHFDVYISGDTTFSSSEKVGSFVAANGPANSFDLALVQTFDLSAAGRYVRLALLDTYSATSTTIGFNEVAFDVSPIPEPGTLLLMVGGLAFVARRLAPVRA